MTSRPNPIRGFYATVAIGWLVLGCAAAVYAQMKAIPAGIAFPLAVAFLMEYPFYVLPGFPAARELLLSRGKGRAATLLALSVPAPWLIYVGATGHFSFPALVLLACIGVAMCFWYVLFPAHPVADMIYLGLFGALMLGKVFARVYPVPFPKLDVSVLGHLMLIRVAATSILAIRGNSGVADYRFLPTGREFLAGLRWFAMLLPVAGGAFWALGLITWRTPPLNPGLGVGIFFGILWVTALSEEFMFRGLLQPWLERATSSPVAALVLTSLLFGSVHLPVRFHGEFPNWRFSMVAGILGLFCGMARRKTGGIQAGMVAHALTVVAWKVFLK